MQSLLNDRETTRDLTSSRLEEIFTLSRLQDYGHCLTLQLLEPGVTQVISMFEPLFLAIFHAYMDFVLDPEDIDDTPKNDLHMSYDRFFR
jgi:hypothetical protein